MFPLQVNIERPNVYMFSKLTQLLHLKFLDLRVPQPFETSWLIDAVGISSRRGWVGRNVWNGARDRVHYAEDLKYGLIFSSFHGAISADNKSWIRIEMDFRDCVLRVKFAFFKEDEEDSGKMSMKFFILVWWRFQK